MELVDISTIIASIITAFSFLFSSLIYFISVSRERKTKTLDYWEQVQPSLIEARQNLQNLNQNEWTKEIAKKHLASSHNSLIISKGLNSFERLSIGINLNIYDIKVIKQLAGKMIIESYIAYIPIIIAREEQIGESGGFREFEKLYARLIKLN
ncbi:DUF4760 domain-containing protein [Aliivibrio fischeri]|uniref:DUF4760 domain-containing protein n=1 Tax=Aliivibrio fischeri TaxID=668 RepID=UPI00107EB6C4|nr:DUF4760 domain-containing protein [Aliivibrio fischeri]MUH97298.1 DUF4760 domain-containing protein [Aliivibrio fischeri]MUI64884.1 DUF4760 domain-containing protein [Aliivibrio fischeri]TGA68294.1 DUF4760 domain-containing protein [Aliivibrio fischeri]